MTGNGAAAFLATANLLRPQVGNHKNIRPTRVGFLMDSTKIKLLAMHFTRSFSSRSGPEVIAELEEDHLDAKHL